jgi:hypothetical protein
MGDDSSVRSRFRLISLGASGVVAAGAVTAAAFIVGSHNPAVTVANGEARVGYDVATAVVDGWAYGVPMDVAWLGTDGSWRQSGRPACLAWTGSPRDVAIRFGWVPITSPDSNGWRQVVWVSCSN